MPRFEGIETQAPCVAPTFALLSLNLCPASRGLRHERRVLLVEDCQSEPMPRFEGIETKGRAYEVACGKV